jgi:hypothetical protein
VNGSGRSGRNPKLTAVAVNGCSLGLRTDGRIDDPGALNAFAATGENPINYIVRHMNLDPGLLGAEDQLQNLRAVCEGTRVFSLTLNRATAPLLSS